MSFPYVLVTFTVYLLYTYSEKEKVKGERVVFVSLEANRAKLTGIPRGASFDALCTIVTTIRARLMLYVSVLLFMAHVY
jgi:hypothetical protein